MLDTESQHIINGLLNQLDKPRRKTAGRDKSKNYHKITISVDEEMKLMISELAESQGLSISGFIKALVTEHVKEDK